HASACAGVGAGKELSNHAATAGWNEDKGLAIMRATALRTVSVAEPPRRQCPTDKALALGDSTLGSRKVTPPPQGPSPHFRRGGRVQAPFQPIRYGRRAPAPVLVSGRPCPRAVADTAEDAAAGCRRLASFIGGHTRPPAFGRVDHIPSQSPNNRGEPFPEAGQGRS
ncbi:MAG: hypothetical protein K0S81_1563, partial [Rhodospirillales bacterium]|nr:hypothetical protein [Rhodospirillales bacterium]